MKNIAIIGSGISGLSAAYILSQKFNVTVFESNNKLGGTPIPLLHLIKRPLIQGLLSLTKKTTLISVSSLINWALNPLNQI